MILKSCRSAHSDYQDYPNLDRLPAVSKQSLRLRLGRYERRFGIYRELVRTLSLVFSDANIFTDELLKFRSGTAESDLLFDPEIPAYIERVLQKGLNVWRTRVALRDPALQRVPEQNKVAQTHSDNIKSFNDQLPLLKGKCRPYLNLADEAVLQSATRAWGTAVRMKPAISACRGRPHARHSTEPCRHYFFLALRTNIFLV